MSNTPVSGSAAGADADELARRAADAERRAADAERRAQEAERRAADAEEEVDRLTAEVAELRAVDEPFSIFGGADPDEAAALGSDGTDPRVVPLALGATAVVGAMVALLALLNGNLFTPFGLVILALTCALAYAATRARPQPVEVNLTRGILYAEHKGTTYRFDLRSDTTQVEMVGQPGDAYWQVKFLRRNMDPFVVDTDMVDPAAFVAQLREYRPSL
ncbi:hypothetical protein [Nocardioides panacisoli]|uniref:hypothetical protein n=1 Tax=Nocardioides panacisoli TaxID=627624 RepID=UPI0031D6DBE2